MKIEINTTSSSETLYLDTQDVVTRILLEIDGGNFIEADQIFQTAMAFFKIMNPEVERETIEKFIVQDLPNPKPNNLEVIFNLQNLAKIQQLNNALSKNLPSKSSSHNINKRAKI